MTDSTPEYLDANRRRWDALTDEHLESPFYDLAGFKAGRDRLRSIELTELGDVRGKSQLHLQCHFGMDTLAWARRGARVERITETGSYATGGVGTASESYFWDFSLGDVINALVNGGLQIDFLHEFPYAARAKFPFMVQGKNGWWRLPPDQHGIIPFLFSLQAHKTAA